jgi:hypothetical protein
MPPLSASVDYVFSGTALSLGGKVAVSTIKFEFQSQAIDDCTNFDIALRLAVHSKILENIENLDVSALLLVGFDFVMGDVYKSAKDAGGIITGFDGFYLGVGLGGRYFFTKNIGIFLEADIKAIIKMSVGTASVRDFIMAA